MKLYYQMHSFGNSEELHQPPLIFLHGMTLSGNEYKYVAPILAKMTKRKAYVPDVRNHGNSPWVNEMDYDVLIQDMLEFMQQNSIPKAILLGGSMGGRIAINFALKYPDKVEALVIGDMTPRNLVSTGDNVVQRMLRLLVDILNSFSPDTDLNEAKRIVFGNIASFLVNTEKVEFVDCVDLVPVVKENGRIRLTCNIDSIKANMLEKDALVQNLPDLETTYEGDALFIYGSDGFFKLHEEQSITKLFPKAIIKRIEDASHLVHIDSPKEYTNIVSNFILHRNFPQSKY